MRCDMGKVLQKLASVPKDKLLHSFYGSLLYAILALIDPITAIIVVTIVAFIKELYDEYKYKGFDILDILATISLPLLIFLN